MKSNLLVYDYESATIPGTNPHKTQPIQVAAIILDPNNLEPIPGATFNSLMCPAGEYDWDEGALQINKKTKEEILDAPPQEQVWKDFADFCKRYRTGKNKWGRPIPCGHNIDSFDNHITARMCALYGPCDDIGKPEIFHPTYSIDTQRIANLWLHRTPEVESFSLKNLCLYMGFDILELDNAHDALFDVRLCGLLVQKFLRLHRTLAPKIKFKDSLANARILSV